MKISIAEFSRVPLSRRREDSDKSGERFRQEILRPGIDEAIRRGDKLEVTMDGLKGMSAAFLEEAFGGLVREDGLTYEQLKDVLEISASQGYRHFKPYIANAWRYMREPPQ